MAFLTRKARTERPTSKTAVHIAAPDEPDNSNTPMLFPPGHYYSPIVDISDIRTRHDEVFSSPESLLGIDLRADAQLALLPTLAALCEDHPYQEHPHDDIRYGFENDFFSYGDGLVLHAMLRHLRPPRYVEIGSGWSSALVLDVADKYLNGKISCTFVEPYPERLHSLLAVGDTQSSQIEIIEKPVAGVDPALFTTLTAGDVLFIDSTHVSRCGSDVNSLFFDVLPALEPGVHVHIHDVFYPFEYPSNWVYEGRNWSEDYLLRAYLINNPKVRINWFNSYLSQHHRAAVAAAMPAWDKNPGGSIWLETLP
jgi:hypothetical protein